MSPGSDPRRVKRSPELIPLSRDHHVALEHALRLVRATDADLPAVTARFLAFFVHDGERHFVQEEELLVPAIPGDARELAQRLLDEHAAIRDAARRLGEAQELEVATELGGLLTAHVRFEERELFPLLEDRLPASKLRDIARALGE